MRWIVERSQDNFDDVGADRFYLDHGDLVFESGPEFGPDNRIEIVYARGQWIVVVPSGDE